MKLSRRELATRYPMHTLPQARRTHIQLVRDYQAKLIGVVDYKAAKTRLFERWSELKPKAWQ
jgi:hypothetical protein